MQKEFYHYLKAGSPDELIEYCKGKTIERVWRNCKRGDWMSWIYCSADNYDPIKFSVCSAHQAKTILEIYPQDEGAELLDWITEMLEKYPEDRIVHSLYMSAEDAQPSGDLLYQTLAHIAMLSALSPFAHNGFIQFLPETTTLLTSSAIYSYYKEVDWDKYLWQPPMGYEDKACEKNRKQTADIARKYLPLPIFIRLLQ